MTGARITQNGEPAANPLITYPGGKNASGVYQALINLMPPHRLYGECCLGSGAVLRNKKPAEFSVASDPDSYAMEVFFNNAGLVGDWRRPLIEFTLEEKPVQLHRIFATGLFDVMRAVWESGLILPADSLLFADPPYIAAECSEGRPLYRFDMTQEIEHEEFLADFRALPCPKIITHYDCDLYNDMLKGWRKVSFNDMTRGGWKQGTAYLSFPPPVELHDYRFWGDGWRKREKVKIKWTALQRKIKNMSPIERSYLNEILTTARAGDIAKTGDGGSTGESHQKR